MKRLFTACLFFISAFTSFWSFASYAPQNFTATVSGNSVNFSWSSVPATAICYGESCTFSHYILTQTGVTLGTYNGEGLRINGRSTTSVTLNNLPVGQHEFSLGSYYIYGTDDYDFFPTQKVNVTISNGVPQTPATISATLSGTTVVVNWSAVQSASTYELQRNAANLTSISTTGYTDSSAAAGSTNSYRVRACNTAGCSSWTTTQAVVQIPPVPGVPYAFGVESLSSYIRLGWQTTTYATTYDVRRDNVIIASPAIATSAGVGVYEDRAVTHGVSYSYTVRACGISGCGGWASAYIGRVAAIPAPPGPISANQNGFAVQVNWNEVTDATSYELQRNSSPLTASESSSYVDGSVIAGASYIYRVRACNTLGCSGWVSSASLTIQPIPTAPASITATPGSSSIALSWQPSSGATSYQLQRNSVPFASVSITTHTDNSAVINTSYTYGVRACNAIGCSAFAASSPVQLITAPSNSSIRSSSSSLRSSSSVISSLVKSSSSLSSSLRSSSSSLRSSSSAISSSVKSSSSLSSSLRSSSSSAISSSSRSSSSSLSSSLSSNGSLLSGEPILPTPEQLISLSEMASIDESGVIPATFNVSATGAAQYQIPLITGKGVNDLFPKIGLAYNSQSGNGIMGLGWSVTGLSYITRCKKTMQQDGANSGIEISSESAYCLDGRRLLIQNDGTYRPEVDDGYTRIIRTGSIAEPDYFTVIYKDGSQARYGEAGSSASEEKPKKSDGTTSSVIFTWGLSRYSDNVGNFIAYIYKSSDSDYLINSINYGYEGGAQASTPTDWTYSLSFGYEDRPDDVVSYTSSLKFVKNKRLKNIIFTSQESHTEYLRTYNLTYNENHSSVQDKLSRLTTIQECIGTSCRQPTRFEWQLPKTTYQQTPYSINLNNDASVTQKLVPADFNGDGENDIAWLQSDNKIYYALSVNGQLQQTSFSNSAYAPYLTGNGNHPFTSTQLVPLDFNGDGRSDIAVRNESSGWSIYLSMPQGNGEWRLSSTPININVNGFGGGSDDNVSFSDVDGDGLVDGLWNGFKANHELSYYRLIDNPNAGALSEPFTFSNQLNEKFVLRQHDRVNEQYFLNYQLKKLASNSTGVADFNGDGTQDFVAYTSPIWFSCAKSTDGYYIWNSNDGSCANSAGNVPYAKSYVGSHEMTQAPAGMYYKPYGINNLTHEYWRSSTFRLVDINRDGLTDIAYLEDTYSNYLGSGGYAGEFIYGGGTWYYILSTGSGFTSQKLLVTSPRPADPSDASLLHSPYQPIVRHDNKAEFIDLNQDGYVDFVYFNFQQKLTFPFFTETNTLMVKYWNQDTNDFDAAQPLCPKGGGACTSVYDQFTRNLGSSDQPTIKNHNFWDMNGDGKNDFVYYLNDRIDVYLAEVEPQPANTITSITNGYGAVTGISYSPISNTDHYAQQDVISSTSCSNDAECWRKENSVSDSAALYSSVRNPFHKPDYSPQSLGKLQHANFLRNGVTVVTHVEQKSPTANSSQAGLVQLDGTYTTEYFYANARMQAGGRGFLGFEKRMVVDKQTGVKTVSEYRQDWPFIGVEVEVEQRTAANHVLSRTQSVWKFRAWSDSFPTLAKSFGTTKIGAAEIYNSKVIEEEYDLVNGGMSAGNRLKTLEKTVHAIDEYLNITIDREVVLDAAGVTIADKTTHSTYGSEIWQKERGLLAHLQVNESRGSLTETRKSSFTYYQTGNKKGLLHTETVEPDTLLSLQTVYSYDDHGNEVQKTFIDAEGTIRVGPRAEYEGKGRYVEKLYENFSGSTDNSVEYQFKNYTYDLYGNVKEERTRVDGFTWRVTKQASTAGGEIYYSGDQTGSWKTITRHLMQGSSTNCPLGTAYYQRERFSGGGEQITCYDVLERVSRVATLGFNGEWSFVDSEYNSNGWLARKSEPYFANDVAYWTEYYYDILGRTVSIESPKTGTTVIGHNGYETTTTDDSGSIKKEVKDALGLTKKIESANGFYIDFSYDAAGRLNTSTNSDGNVITTNHNKRGFKFYMNDPNSGSINYTYNGFGEVLTQTNANNSVTTNTYDFKGRLKTRVDKNSSAQITGSATWHYDTAVNGLGKVKQVTDTVTNYTQEFFYDVYGRNIKTKTTFPGKNAQMEDHFERVVYDAYGRVLGNYDAARASENWSSNVVKYSYNQYGYLFQVKDASNDSSYYLLKNLDSRGNSTDIEYGNGMQSVQVFNKASGYLEGQRVTSPSILLAGQDIQNRTYEWDSLGNLDYRLVRGVKKSGSSFVARSLTEDFSYDNMNRLTGYAVSGDGSSSVSVTYHLNGNIKSKSDVGGSNYVYGSSRPHAVTSAGGKSYAYDNSGNVISDGTGRTMVYTAFGQLSSVTKGSSTTKYYYAPDRSVFKREDISAGSTPITTLTIGSVEKQFYADGTYRWKRYINKNVLVTQLFSSAGVLQGATTDYILYDHLGSLTHIVGSDGVPKDILDFDPWGKRRDPSNFNALSVNDTQAKYFINTKPSTSNGFTNHEMIDEVGLVHMNGRVQDPALGMFIQVDPLVEDVSSTQAFNRYSYVQNNPLNATDPTGYSSDRDREVVEEVLVTGRQMSNMAQNVYDSGGNVGIVSIPVDGASYFAYFTGTPFTDSFKLLGITTKSGFKNFGNSVASKGFAFANLKSGSTSKSSSSIKHAEGRTYTTNRVETPQERIDRLVKGVRDDHPNLPKPENLKILAEEGKGIDGDPNAHGIFDSADQIRIAYEDRSDNFIRSIIFHELAHLDEALTVALGSVILWKSHEALLDGGHDKWTQDAGIQYWQWLNVRDQNPDYLHHFDKPNIDNAPWRK